MNIINTKIFIIKKNHTLFYNKKINILYIIFISKYIYL